MLHLWPLDCSSRCMHCRHMRHGLRRPPAGLRRSGGGGAAAAASHRCDAAPAKHAYPPRLEFAVRLGRDAAAVSRQGQPVLLVQQRQRLEADPGHHGRLPQAVAALHGGCLHCQWAQAGMSGRRCCPPLAGPNADAMPRLLELWGRWRRRAAGVQWGQCPACVDSEARWLAGVCRCRPRYQGLRQANSAGGASGAVAGRHHRALEKA